MMISPPTSGDPYAAAAALDRQLRSSSGDGVDAPPDVAAPDGGPDVVVTLGQGPSAPATYNASGRFARAPTLDELGANGPNAMAHATESNPPDGAVDGAASSGDASNDPSVDQNAAIAA